MRNLIAAIGNTLLLWSMIIQTEEALFGTHYAAIFLVINSILGLYGLYVRWLIHTANEKVLDV